jgi:hypothetical protein
MKACLFFFTNHSFDIGNPCLRTFELGRNSTNFFENFEKNLNMDLRIFPHKRVKMKINTLNQLIVSRLLPEIRNGRFVNEISVKKALD